MSEYVEYIKSKEWQDRRLEFLKYAEYLCEECGGKATHVHHINYDSLGDEEEGDVKCLCRDCHLWMEHGDKGYEDIDDGYGEY